MYAVGKDATRYGIIVKYSLDGNEEKAVSYAKTDTLGFSSIVKKKDNFIFGKSCCNFAAAFFPLIPVFILISCKWHILFIGLLRRLP